MESSVEETRQSMMPENSDVIVAPHNSSPIDQATRKNIQILPKDKGNFVLFTFYLLGVGVLLPWFFFLTAANYWMYKFRLLPQNDTLFHDILGDAGDASELQTVFMGYMSFVSTIASTVTLCVYQFFGRKFSLRSRMYFSISSMFMLFVTTTALVRVNTDQWQDIFFYLTLGTVMLLNVSSAILQVSIFSVAALFPPRYMTALTTGLALGGVFAAIAQIVSLWVGASPQNSAFVYFVIADVFIMLSLIFFLITERTIFFKFYLAQSNASVGSSIQYEHLPSMSSTGSLVIRRVDYTVIMKKIWMCAFAICMCFFVSISLFPSITVLIEPVSSAHNDWNTTYFKPVITYLIYSACDCLGRLLAGLVKYPKESDWRIVFFSLARIAFIPLFMLCNAQPLHHTRHFPVLIASDVWYTVITIFFGLTNGYLANIVLIVVLKAVEPYEQEVTASITSAFLGLGLTLGSGLGLLWIRLL